MSWILDIASVVVVGIFLTLGIHRGFIKTAIHLIGLVLALCVAGLASMPLAEWIYDSFLAEPLRAAVAEHAAEATVAAMQTVQEQITRVIELLPSVVKSAFELSGMTVTQSGAPLAAEPLTQVVMDSVVRPMCLSMLQATLFLVLFLLLFVIIVLIGKGINKVFTTLPIIRQINSLLGGVLGAVEGVAMVYVLTLVLKLYMTMSGASSIVTTADIQATYLLHWVMDFRLFG